MRRTFAQIKAAGFGEAGGQAHTAEGLVLTMTKTKSGDAIGFKATFNMYYVDGAVAIAGDNGQVKTFDSVDNLIKSMAKFGLWGTGRFDKITIANPDMLDPAPFAGDLVAKARRDIAAYTVKETALRSEQATMTANILLMPELTSAEQAFKAERVARRDAVQGTADYYAAEIARLNAIVNPA